MSEESFEQRFPRFWTLQIAGWTIYAVVMYVTFLTVVPEGSFLRLWNIKVFRACTGFSLTTLLWLLYRGFGRRQSLNRVTWMVIPCSVVVGMVWTVIENGYYSVTTVNFDWNGAVAKSPRVALDYAITVLAWSGLYFGITFWRQWEIERERTLQAKALANQAQLEMLRYQLNPHFLFNALNSIRASIDEDSHRAKRMVTEFSEFLRFSLLQRNSATVPLREEIEAVRNYLSIEKIRFEEKLEIAFDISPSAEEFPIPGFLIHPLVENAIKHGLTNDGKPLHVKVSARMTNGSLVVEVANTGNLSMRNGSNGTGTGLDNIRGRLARLYPESHEFSLTERDGWIRASIRIDVQTLEWGAFFKI